MPTRHDDQVREEVDFSQGKRGAVLPHEGKTRITIWIDTATLNWFRAEAERQGQGYQTALNAALRQYAEREGRSLQEVVRELVREEIQALRHAQGAGATP